MARLAPVAFALFVTGGLLSGMLGISNLAQFADTRDVPPDTSTRASELVPTPIAVRAAFPMSVLDQLPSDPVAGRAMAAANAGDAHVAGRWSLLYVADGDLWLATAGATLELTHDGHVGQPALGRRRSGLCGAISRCIRHLACLGRRGATPGDTRRGLERLAEPLGNAARICAWSAAAVRHSGLRQS